MYWNTFRHGCIQLIEICIITIWYSQDNLLYPIYSLWKCKKGWKNIHVFRSMLQLSNRNGEVLTWLVNYLQMLLDDLLHWSKHFAYDFWVNDLKCTKLLMQKMWKKKIMNNCALHHMIFIKWLLVEKLFKSFVALEWFYTKIFWNMKFTDMILA